MDFNNKLLGWEEGHIFIASLEKVQNRLKTFSLSASIVQWDVLNFSISAEHVSPDFPDGYWPKKATPNQEQDWINSVDIFKAELEEMKNLARNPEVNLFAPIPHGNGQTILREINVVADHNSYHLGQLMLIKKMF